MTELAALEVIETQDTKPDPIEHCWCAHSGYKIALCGEKRKTPAPHLGYVPDNACVVCLDLHQSPTCAVCGRCR